MPANGASCRACGEPEATLGGGVFSPSDWRCPGGYLAEDCPHPEKADSSGASIRVWYRDGLLGVRTQGRYRFFRWRDGAWHRWMGYV